MLELLLQAAANPGIKVDPSWGPTTTIAAIQTVLTLVIGGGGLYGLFRGVALLWKMWNETKALDAQGAAAVRKEMMELNDRQTTRIQTLEDDLREERKRCDEELAALRKTSAEETAQLRISHAREVAAMRLVHADEMRDMGKRLDALHAQMVQMQRSTGSMINTAAAAPTATARTDRDVSDGIGQALRQTFGIPTEDEL